MYRRTQNFLSEDTHQVKVAIEGHEGADKHTTVEDRDPHAVIHVLQHLAAARHRLLKERSRKSTGSGSGRGKGRDGHSEARGKNIKDQHQKPNNNVLQLYFRLDTAHTYTIPQSTGT